MAWRQQLGANSNSGNSASLAVTLTASPASDGSYIAAVKWGGGKVLSSVVDSRGNTWTVDVVSSATGATVAIASCLAPATPLVSGDTVTFSASGSGPGIAVQIEEYDPLSSLDQTANAQASRVTSVSVGPTSTTTSPNETAITAGGDGMTGTWTPPGSPWAERASSGLAYNAVDMADQDVSSTGTFSATWLFSSNNNMAAAIATYIKAGGGGGTTYNDSGSGTITFSGSAADSYQLPGQTFNDTGSGALSFGSTCTESATHTSFAAGVVQLSGARTESLSSTWTSSGTLLFAGSSSDNYVPPSGPGPTLYVDSAALLAARVI